MRMSAPVSAAIVGCLLVGGLAIAEQDPSQGSAIPATPSASQSVSPSASPSSSSSIPPAATANASSLIAQSVELPFVLNYLHHVNELQIAQANAALPILTDSSAITLAQTMITDDTANEQQVVALAAIKGINLLPFQPSTSELAANDALATLATPAYDSSFMGLVLEEKLSALYELQLMTNLVADPDVLSLVSSTIPTVQSHIRLAGGTVPPAPASPFPRPVPTSSPSPKPSPSASPSHSPSPSPSTSPSHSPSPSPSTSP